MDFKVIFLGTFLEDLERIVRLIAAHNPAAALKLGQRMVQTGVSLSFFPERHPSVRQRPATRRLVVARHFKVFSRVKSESRTVEVLRCWDGRRGTDPTMP